MAGTLGRILAPPGCVEKTGLDEQVCPLPACVAHSHHHGRGQRFFGGGGGSDPEVVAALNQNSIIDRGILLISMFGLSMPAYWLGLVLIFLLVVKVHWFPSTGIYSIVGGGGVIDLMKHLALPAVAGSAVAAGIITRTARSAMLEVLRQDFMTGLRAKGLSERAVWRLAFRNALPPIATMVGLQLAYLLLGSEIFVEIIFTWPGIGLQTFTAVFNRDIPMIQVIVVLTTCVFVLMNLLVDVLYLFLNPRVRHA